MTTRAPPLDLSAHTVALHDLVAADPSVQAAVRATVHRAFGPAGPGLLIVDGLPSTFQRDRAAIATAALALAALPPDRLAALEFPSLDYALGWSRGRETFEAEPDTLKASFYANPLHDDPARGDQALVDKYPHYMHPNCWPDADATAELKPAFQALGALMHRLALHITGHIDTLLQTLRPSLKAPSLRSILERSRSAKGRLLHYYATSGASDAKEKERPWCGFHNDHGLLTGLLSAQCFDPVGNPVPDADPAAGLFVVPASGGPPRRAHIPPAALAFQIGETAQLLSAGLLRATAHGVLRSTRAPALRRVTLALFLQPDPWDVLRVPRDGADDADAHADADSMSDGLTVCELVPSLAKRFSDGISFGQFSQNTFREYY